MKNIFYKSILGFLFLASITACSPPAKLYPANEKIYAGRFPDAEFNALKGILSQSFKQIKDTLIIRYDYNHESCWNRLDMETNEHINGVVRSRQSEIQGIISARPAVSIFSFLERGNDFNKLKKFDNSILVDSSGQLMKLAFNDKAICGNSIIVLPDAQYVFIRSDAHFDALGMSKDEILRVLNAGKK